MSKPSVREQLQVSAFDFRLCGSRALGTHREDSDWDYCVTVCDGLGVYLTGLGFSWMEEGGRSYEGGHTLSMCEIIDGGEKIQVAIMADSSLKVCATKALAASPELRALDASLTKPERDRLWEALLDLADGQSDGDVLREMKLERDRDALAQRVAKLEAALKRIAKSYDEGGECEHVDDARYIAIDALEKP